MKERCSASDDELNHDRKQIDVDEDERKEQVKERADEIMGNCCLLDSDENALMTEMIVNSDDVLGRVMDLAWKFKPDCNVYSDLKLVDVIGLASAAQAIVDSLNVLAKAAAEAEADD